MIPSGRILVIWFTATVAVCIISALLGHQWERLTGGKTQLKEIFLPVY